MNKLFLGLLMGLVACQSVRDPESQIDLTSNTTLSGEASFSTDQLAHLSKQCDEEIAQLHQQRAAVSAESRREFSIALGQAAQACRNLQHTATLLNQTAQDKATYDNALALARGLTGIATPQQPDTFPEAVEEDIQIEPLRS